MIMKTSLVGQSPSASSTNTENIGGFETGPIVNEKNKKSLLGSEQKISSPKSFSPRNQDRLKKDGEERYRSLQNILNSSDRSESKSKSFHQTALGIVVIVNPIFLPISFVISICNIFSFYFILDPPSHCYYSRTEKFKISHPFFETI